MTTVNLRRIAADRADFLAVLEEFGFTEEAVLAQTRNLGDYEPLTRTSMRRAGVWVRPSKIQGLGLFARREFWPGQSIVLARDSQIRTQAGRYVNHSRDPNGYMRVNDERWITLHAERWIVEGDEITTDYRRNLGIQIKPVAQRG